MKKVILSVIVTLLLTNGSVAQAEILIFDTSDSQFDAGVDNQGWWSDTSANIDDNDEYTTGIFLNSDHRSFFTFDLSSLEFSVISATLELTRFSYWSSSGSESHTLGLFDVSTDAITLNNNVGISESIYDDLGSGTSYGEFEILRDELSTDVLSFGLNSAAIGDINAAKGSWFSVGGSLLSASAVDVSEYFFGNSQDGGVQHLIVEVVPEPATLVVFGIGGLLLRKRSR